MLLYFIIEVSGIREMYWHILNLGQLRRMIGAIPLCFPIIQ